jgi:hypothetical protein
MMKCEASVTVPNHFFRSYRGCKKNAKFEVEYQMNGELKTVNLCHAHKKQMEIMIKFSVLKEL